MRNGNWHDGHGHWLMMIPMVVVTIAVLALLLWVALSSTRRQAGAVGPTVGAAPIRQTPQEILAERLARGEIEPDDYRRRLDALDGRPPA